MIAAYQSRDQQIGHRPTRRDFQPLQQATADFMPCLFARAAPRCMRESGNLQQITRVDYSRLTLWYQASPLQCVVDFKATLRSPERNRLSDAEIFLLRAAGCHCGEFIFDSVSSLEYLRSLGLE